MDSPKRSGSWREMLPVDDIFHLSISSYSPRDLPYPNCVLPDFDSTAMLTTSSPSSDTNLQVSVLRKHARGRNQKPHNLVDRHRAH